MKLIVADVEGLAPDHDQVFMSFNIEHWYSILGPTRTAATTFLPISKEIAIELVALHNSHQRHPLTKHEIRQRIKCNPVLAKAATELQSLIPLEGAFLKTSARSCKDVALEIGLDEQYRKLLESEIAMKGKQIEEMRLRTLFMEAGRLVLRFHNALDFLIACVLSNRVWGVFSGLFAIELTAGH